MNISIGILFGIIAMICWGVADFFVAKAVRKAGAFKTFLWSRIIGVILMFLVFALFFGFPVLSISAISIILVTGLLSVISYLAFYKGLQVGKVSIISPIAACWAVVTVILSLVFLDEKMTAVQGIGATLAIIGAVLTSFRLHDLYKLKNPAKGLGYAIIALFAWGVLFVFIDVLVSELSWFLPMLLTGGVSIIYLLAYSGAAKKNISFPKNVWLFVILIGILEVIAFLSYGIGITSEYTAIVAPVSAAFPAVTIFLARLFLKERLEMNQKIGVISVLAGLIVLAV